jgi:hypothetical protein
MEQQQRVIEICTGLRRKGYVCEFAWTFDMAKKIIDDYLN